MRGGERKRREKEERGKRVITEEREREVVDDEIRRRVGRAVKVEVRVAAAGSGGEWVWWCGVERRTVRWLRGGCAGVLVVMMVGVKVG